MKNTTGVESQVNHLTGPLLQNHLSDKNSFKYILAWCCVQGHCSVGMLSFLHEIGYLLWWQPLLMNPKRFSTTLNKFLWLNSRRKKMSQRYGLHKILPSHLIFLDMCFPKNLEIRALPIPTVMSFNCTIKEKLTFVHLSTRKIINVACSHLQWVLGPI